MSKKLPIYSAVLTVLGLLATGWADPAEPPGAEPTPEPTATTDQQGVVLLVDGRVLQGVIVQDDSGCLVKTRFGSMRFPQRRIEASFRTLREAYEYKLSQFPEEDVSERLKLAQWCLGQNLEAEAKAQLNGILKINPKYGPALAMLLKLDQAQARQNQRRMDPDVRQASASADESPASNDPLQIDPATLRRAQPQPSSRPAVGGVAEVPNIFNLSRPSALKLSEDFNRGVHPILQTRCAQCHNERYTGDFLLRQVRKPRDLNRDTLNLNLESTLQLVDPVNPSRSELLSSTLRPHGYGKTQRPIFPGSNDPSYQRLSQWVNNVCQALKRDEIRQTSAQADSVDEEERFAADRTAILSDPDAPNRKVAPNPRIAPPQQSISPARQPIPGAQGMIPPPRGAAPTNPGSTADPGRFPLVNQENATALRTNGAVQIPPGFPDQAARMQAQAQIQAQAQAQIQAQAQAQIQAQAQVQAEARTSPQAAPLDDQTGLETASAVQPAANASPGKPKAPAPVKIDPAALERLLKARNGGN